MTEAQESSEKEYKIVVLGGGGVGKSALTIRLVNDNFLDEYDPTIEDSYRKTVEIDGETCMLDILDTAGQEDFSALRDAWIREANGFLLVYSITKRDTFDEVISLYQKILRVKEDEQIFIVLAGNKCDLEDQRQVSTDEGKKLASQWSGAIFYETSAKLKINNEDCFFDVARLIRDNKPNIDDDPEKPNGCECCTIL